MHNLSTVFKFELIRTLKKKTFWIMALAFPLMIGAVFGIVVASNLATESAVEELSREKFAFAVTDQSNVIKPELLAAFDVQNVADKQTAIQQVREGKLDAYFYYPADLTTQKVELYAQDVGIFLNSKYSSVASLLLRQSVDSEVTNNQKAVLTGSTSVETTTFRDGEVYDAIRELIAPGLFLVLFYFLMAFFGNQMLTSTTEEKENRVIEMLLTTVQARTLIIGKILSLVVLGFIQGLIIIIPILIGFLVARQYVDVPDVDLATLPLDWARIGIGAAVFAVSFLLFTGLLVAIGAAVPTAKEAGSFFGVVMILIFGPLYAAPLFVSAPDSLVVQALTYFPLTAPIPLMLRNAVDNLTLTEAAIALSIMTLTAIIILNIAVRVFRYGALEYSRKLSLREIFRV